jgi:transcription antitermination factor NusG
MSWFVVHTHAKKEFLASANIQRQGFETFFPTFIYTYPRVGDRLRPLFPNYLFVQFDPDTDHWYPLCHTTGVRRLFSTYPQMQRKQFNGYLKPTPVSDQLIASLREQVVQVPKQPSIPVIEPGTTVRVVSGHFEGRQGICSWANNRRVALLLDVLNGKLEISFSRNTVEIVDGSPSD